MRLFSSFLCVLLVACDNSSENPQVDGLADNKALWESNASQTYRFNFNRICYCDVRETIVHVENNEIQHVIFADDGTETTTETYLTIDGLFSIIEDAIARNAHQVDVQFHPKLGYPTRVYIDYSSQSSDEEITYTVDNMYVNENLYANLNVISSFDNLPQSLQYNIQNGIIEADELRLTIETSGCGSSYFKVYVSTALSKSLPPQAETKIVRGPANDNVCDGIFTYDTFVDLTPLQTNFAGQEIVLSHDQFSLAYTP